MSSPIIPHIGGRYGAMWEFVNFNYQIPIMYKRLQIDTDRNQETKLKLIKKLENSSVEPSLAHVYHA